LLFLSFLGSGIWICGVGWYGILGGDGGWLHSTILIRWAIIGTIDDVLETGDTMS
jgi:hypothetical protein